MTAKTRDYVSLRVGYVMGYGTLLTNQANLISQQRLIKHKTHKTEHGAGQHRDWTNKMTNDIDMNLELRSEILEVALNLEKAVNDLLLALLSIDIPIRKAISNRSGNLSFKNKIDLLFDLDVMSSDEHKTLLLLMEFRNQFLHNIECSSFSNAVSQLGRDKEKKLLKFDDAEDLKDKEFSYKNAFRTLNIKCLNIICNKVEDRRNQIEERRKTIVKPVEAQIFFVDKYFDLIEKIMVKCEQSISETPEFIKLINQIAKTVNDDDVMLNHYVHQMSI